jgi:hypothetical protein
MSLTAWEYCHIELFDPGENQTAFYVMYHYHPILGVERMQLATKLATADEEREPWEFQRLVAVLGQLGWELVSVVHNVYGTCNYQPGTSNLDTISFRQNTVFPIAYFKKPIDPGSITARITGFGITRVDPLPA